MKLNFLIQEPGNFAALCLASLAFLMPLFVSELKKRKSIMFAYFFLIFIHQIIAFLNSYLFAIGKGGIVGAKLDANLGFHSLAKELALNAVYYDSYKIFYVPISLDSFTKDKHFFSELLGTVYKFFGTSHLLGEQISILCFAFSCIIFLKLLKLLEIKNFNCSSLIFFGALPSVILFGSVTLRESYEVLFFMLAVYFGLRISLNHKLSIPFTLLMMLSAFIMGMFHAVLMFYAFFLIFILLVWTLPSKNCIENIVVFLVFFICFIFLSKTELHIFWILKGFFEKINDGGFISWIEGFRETRRTLSARTNYNYDVPIDNSSSMKIVLSFINIYSHYLFEPYVWKIRSFYDYFVSAEALMRTVLIILSISHWWKAVGLQKKRLGVLILLYFTITFLWAMGTVNYGTSVRHHVMSWWILTLVGVPFLMQYLRCGIFLASTRKPDHEQNA